MLTPMSIAVLFVLMLLTGSMASAETGDGGHAGAFMQVGLSPRAVGMGQAYLAVSDDAAGIFYNPAGTTHILKRKVGFAYRAMDFDRKLGYASLSLPVRNEATIAVGWIFAGVGDIVERDRLGEPGDKLDYSENALSLCFARRFSDIVSIGGTGKYHMSKLANVTTNTAGFDLGLYIRLAKGAQIDSSSFLDMLRFGAVVGNLGASYIWNTGKYWQQFGELGDSHTDDFPILIGGGVSAQMFKEKLLVAVDARKYQWHSLRLHAGAEYAAHEVLKLRAGLDDLHPTFGGSVSKSYKLYTLSIEYAFATAKAGERADHIFGIGFVF
jgi:hypothetical protein